jgi:hypothetical protein
MRGKEAHHMTNFWTTLICSRAARRTSTLGLVITLVGGLAIGCGDDDDGGGDSKKCDEAAMILENCDMEAEDLSECNAEAQAQADCVIKNPEGACSESLSSPESQEFFNCLVGE